jgi:aminodeoxyfutalosine synthase
MLDALLELPDTYPAAESEAVAPDLALFAEDLRPLAEKVLSGARLTHQDGLALSTTADLNGLFLLAQHVASQKHGSTVYYVSNGHINYSNYCTLSCQFCSFYRRKGTDRREGGYEMALDEVFEQAEKIAGGGATELHIVGGLHPDFPFSYYIEMLAGIRARHPRLGLKCFTAIEIYHLAQLAERSPRDTLRALIEAGLDSLPGGGAEILDDAVRDKICRGKESSSEWLELHRTAHQLGLPSNATLLHGHVETAAHRVEHLLQLRQLQDETQGFLAFIPLSYHPAHNALRVKSKHGPSALDELRQYALARLMLDNFPHIKSYWVMLGLRTGQMALSCGASDLDGTVVQEKIYHMAGSDAPQALSVEQLHHLIRESGRTPVERDHLYRRIERGPGGPLDWRVAGN